MPLSENEIEKQLTQRRLDTEGYELKIKQLQSQLNDLKRNNEGLQASLDSVQSTLDSLMPGGFNAAQHIFRYTAVFKQAVTFVARATFSALASFTAGLITSLIYPPSDGTTAIKVTKANGTTAVLTLDSTNDKWIIPSQFNLFLGSTTERLKLYYDTTSHFGQINSFDGAIYRQLDIDGDALKLNHNSNGALHVGGTSSTIGFFDATPAAKQTLAAYTTNAQGSYTGLATGLGGSPYANVTDLNALRGAYENIRAAFDDLRTKLQTTTLVG